VPQAVLDQFRAAIGDWPDLERDEVPTPEVLAACAQAAEAVLQACPTREALFDLSSAVEEEVLYWIPRFAEVLAQAGQTEVALRIADRLAQATSEPGHHELGAEVLRQAGRHDEALARLAQIQHRDPTDADLLRVRIAKVLVEKSDPAGAEEELRRLLDRRWLSGRVREHAVPLLGAVLRATGREPEAQALERERRKQFAAAHPEVPHTVRRDGPKVGRNDPCPCPRGRGKNYKRCHGRLA
jgi:Flp pilus assembly protein TadD